MLSRIGSGSRLPQLMDSEWLGEGGLHGRLRDSKTGGAAVPPNGVDVGVAVLAGRLAAQSRGVAGWNPERGVGLCRFGVA